MGKDVNEAWLRARMELGSEAVILNTKNVRKKGIFGFFSKLERNYKSTIEASEISDNILEVKEDILNETIHCEHNSSCSHQCTNAFRIIPEELQFYKRMNLPIPRICLNCRYFIRLKRTSPWRLYHRSCMKEGCTNEFETPYAPERPEIVYCERCYQNEVY